MNQFEKFYVFFITLLAVFFIVTNGFAFECTGSVYNNPAMTTPLENFSPYEKIYLKIECEDLPVAGYTVAVDWINSDLEVVRQDYQTFNISVKQDQVVPFWFKLLKKGPIERNFTNSDFPLGSLGTWKIHSYLNSKNIYKGTFHLN